jgi:formylglycine-generating enzyme required for sulfatase activity
LSVDEFTEAPTDSGVDSTALDSTVDSALEADSDVDTGNPVDSTVDTSVTKDSSVDTAPDVVVDTSMDTAAETAIDSAIDDTADAELDSAADTEPDTAIVDSGAETDSGPPPPPPPECTVAGPSATDTVCVAGKTFNLGATNATACSPSGCSVEKPVSVQVSTFVLDRYEVTVGDFRSWWATSPMPPKGVTFFTATGKSIKWPNTGWAIAEPNKATGTCTWKGATDASNDALPLNCVDWYTALAYCMSKSMRLPTEAEWEAAASAGTDRLFPWSAASTENNAYTSSDADCAHAIFGGCGETPLTFVKDGTPWGVSRNGAHDLAGSLSEWVLDGTASTVAPYTFTAGTVDPVEDPTVGATGTYRIARGGNYATPIASLRAAARPTSATAATSKDFGIGFRCAKR